MEWKISLWWLVKQDEIESNPDQIGNAINMEKFEILV